MQPRTRRQKEVLDFITRYVSRNGHEPSYQLIARQLGVTAKSGIARHIEALESQGLISRRRENGSFGLRLHSQNIVSDSVCKIEFFDSPAIDGPAESRMSSELVIPVFMLGSLSPDEVFAFKAIDDSMVDKQISEADIVLLERRSYARSGDVVVAETSDKKMALGQFFHIGIEIEIRPGNSEYETAIFPADNVTILGLMRGMLCPIPAIDN